MMNSSHASSPKQSDNDHDNDVAYYGNVNFGKLFEEDANWTRSEASGCDVELADNVSRESSDLFSTLIDGMKKVSQGITVAPPIIADKYARRSDYPSRLAKEEDLSERTQYRHKAARIARTSRLKTQSEIKPLLQMKLSFTSVPQPFPAALEPLNTLELFEPLANGVTDKENMDVDGGGSDEFIGQSLADVGTLAELEPRPAPEPWTKEEMLVNISKIKKKALSSKGTMKMRSYEDLMMVEEYIKLLRQGKSKAEASRIVCHGFRPGRENVYASRRLRSLFNHFATHHHLPAETRGGHRDGSSFLDDKDIFQACIAWLREQEPDEVTTKNLAKAVNLEILPRFGKMPKNPLSARTALRWMIRLGFEADAQRKGVYVPARG